MPRRQSSQWEFENLFDSNPEPEGEPVKQAKAPKPLKIDKPQVLTVGALTREIRKVLEGGFRSVHVSGEISNFRAQSSGHCYFTLKDGDAQLSCVLFRGERVSHREHLQQGVKLVLKGDISVYMPRGQYQLIVRGIELDGVGALQLAFEKLKNKLKAEGLFDAERKRPLPKYPSRIGVVTSSSGAAIRDVAHVLGRRHPGLELIIASCRVQGQGAAEEIAEAMSKLNRWQEINGKSSPIDMILLTRGGGSLEDLWSFNEEIVARAIADSSVPVVSGVGHEIDFTISDFVADIRAATPSAAAELISEGVMGARQFLAGVNDRIVGCLQSYCERATNHLGHVERRLDYLHPRRVIERHAQRLDDLNGDLHRSSGHHLKLMRERLQKSEGLIRSLHPDRQLTEQIRQFTRLRRQFLSAVSSGMVTCKNQLERVSSQLNLLGPVQVLSRGYSISQSVETGEIIKSSKALKADDLIKTHVFEGDFISRIER